MWCRPSLSSRSRHNVLSQPSGNTSKLIRPPKSRRQHQSCILTSPNNHQSCFLFFCSFLNVYGNTKQWAKIFPKQRDNWTNERKSFFFFFFYEDKRAKTTPLTPRHTVSNALSDATLPLLCSALWNKCPVYRQRNSCELMEAIIRSVNRPVFVLTVQWVCRQMSKHCSNQVDVSSKHNHSVLEPVW